MWGQGPYLGRMYKTGDKVTVPDPDGNGRIAATFLNTADETVTIANSRWPAMSAQRTRHGFGTTKASLRG
jgi:hypothetical protein